MKQRRRRQCRHCQALFDPDPRNVRHQKYCAKVECRKASKVASQRRWLNKAVNKNYFRGPENVLRVQTWRQAHPGYWRRKRSISNEALQDDSLAQTIELADESGILMTSTLQDLLANPSLILIGLIAHITGYTLQDDIVDTGRRLVGLGGDILNPQGGQHVDQARVMPSTGPPDSRSVQLD